MIFHRVATGIERLTTLKSYFKIMSFFDLTANLCMRINKHNVFIASYLMNRVFLTRKQGIK